MTFAAVFQRVCRFVFKRDMRAHDVVRDEVAAELESHLQIIVEECVKDGLSPDEAWEEAARRFGDLDGITRDCVGVRRPFGGRILAELDAQVAKGTLARRQGRRWSLSVLDDCELRTRTQALASSLMELDVVNDDITRVCDVAKEVMFDVLSATEGVRLPFLDVDLRWRAARSGGLNLTVVIDRMGYSRSVRTFVRTATARHSAIHGDQPLA